MLILTTRPETGQGVVLASDKGQSPQITVKRRPGQHMGYLLPIDAPGQTKLTSRCVMWSRGRIGQKCPGRGGGSPAKRMLHTCCTSAPVASHRAEMELMEEMRCARKALAVSFDSSALHRLAVRILSSGTQCWYTLFSTLTACLPLGVSLPPISTWIIPVRSESMGRSNFAARHSRENGDLSKGVGAMG